jgi:hypothetical protein
LGITLLAAVLLVVHRVRSAAAERPASGSSCPVPGHGHTASATPSVGAGHRFTLEGIATMRAFFPDGTPGEIVLEPHDAFADAAAVALDPRFNPEQRDLDSGAFERLSSLLDAANRELADLQLLLAEEKRRILSRKTAAGEIERTGQELELSPGQHSVVVLDGGNSPGVIHLDDEEAARVDSMNDEIQARFEDAVTRIQAIFS